MTEDPTITTAIIHAVITRPNQEPRKGSILLRDGKILEILPDQLPSLPRSVKRINADNCRVCPGFIDLHVHGAGGRHFLDPPYRKLESILRTLHGLGTTSLLPTLSAASPKEILAYLSFIREHKAEGTLSSSILGVNLEGPFLSIGKRGAQPLRALRQPDISLLDQILKEGEGLIKIMTLAPELEGALKLVPRLKKAGVIPAAGHTQADYEITVEALKKGLSYATHFFNSYPPLHHRAPGPLAAVLEAEKVDLELIADGFHVSPVMIRLLFRLKEFEHIILVTDGTAALGERLTTFSMGGREVNLEQGAPRLRDGTLVGSTVSLNRSLKNIIEFVGLPFSRALALVTLHPARVLGISSSKGDLGEGMDADLVIMDEKFNVKRTIVAGRTVYSSPGSDKKEK